MKPRNDDTGHVRPRPRPAAARNIARPEHPHYFVLTPDDDLSLGGRCRRCGHLEWEFCTACGREFLCGSLSEPCPEAGCLERREAIGGYDAAPHTSRVEPRMEPGS